MTPEQVCNVFTALYVVMGIQAVTIGYLVFAARRITKNQVQMMEHLEEIVGKGR